MRVLKNVNLFKYVILVMTSSTLLIAISYFTSKNNVTHHLAEGETQLDLLKENWNKICFGYPPEPNLTYKINNKIISVIRLPSDEYYIEEDYVPHSPADKCFNKGQKFNVVKIKTVEKYKLIIRVKG